MAIQNNLKKSNRLIQRRSRDSQRPQHWNPRPMSNRGSCEGYCGQWDSNFTSTEYYMQNGDVLGPAAVYGILNGYSCDDVCIYFGDCGFDFCEVCGSCDWTCDTPWPEYSPNPNASGQYPAANGDGCGDFNQFPENYCECGEPGHTEHNFHPSCTQGLNPPNCDGGTWGCQDLTCSDGDGWNFYTPGGYFTCFNAETMTFQGQTSPEEFGCGNTPYANQPGCNGLTANEACCACGGGESGDAPATTSCSDLTDQQGNPYVCCHTRTVDDDGTGASYHYGCKTQYNCVNHPHPDHMGDVVPDDSCTSWHMLPNCNCGSAGQGCPSGFVCDHGGGTYPGCDSNYYHQHGQSTQDCYCTGVSPVCQVQGTGYNASTGVCVPTGDQYGNGLCATSHDGEGDMIMGCTDPAASNYDPYATSDDGTCEYYGCTDPAAENYNPNADYDDGSCIYLDQGCSNPGMCNYNGEAPGPDSCMSVDCGCIEPSFCCDGTTPPTCEFGKSEHAPDSWGEFNCNQVLCDGCKFESQGPITYCNYDPNCNDYIENYDGSQSTYTRCQWTNPSENCEECPTLNGCWTNPNSCNYLHSCDGQYYPDGCPDGYNCEETCCESPQVCASGQQTCDGLCPCLPSTQGGDACPILFDMSAECEQAMCNNNTCPAPCNIECIKPVNEEYADFYPNDMNGYCEENTPEQNRPWVCVTPDNYLDGSNNNHHYNKNSMDQLYGVDTGSHIARGAVEWDWSDCECVGTNSEVWYSTSSNGMNSCKWTDNEGYPTGNYSGENADAAWAVCVDDGQGVGGGARCRNDHMSCASYIGTDAGCGTFMIKGFSDPWDGFLNNQCHCDPCLDSPYYTKNPYVFWTGTYWVQNENGYCGGYKKPSPAPENWHMDDQPDNSQNCGGWNNCGYDFFSECQDCAANDYGCNTGNNFCGEYIYLTLSRNLYGCNCDYDQTADCSEDHKIYISGCYDGCDNLYDDCEDLTDWWNYTWGPHTIEDPMGGSCNNYSNTGTISLTNEMLCNGWGSGSVCSTTTRDYACIYVGDNVSKCLTTTTSAGWNSSVDYEWNPANASISLSNYNGVTSCNNCGHCNQRSQSGGGGHGHHITLDVDSKTGKLVKKKDSKKAPQTPEEREAYKRKAIAMEGSQRSELNKRNSRTAKRKRKKGKRDRRRRRGGKNGLQ